jgi:hypothetical protein
MNDSICFQSSQSVQIYLNSKNAKKFLNGSYKSNLIFYFNDMVEIGPSVIETKLSVVNAQIPCSFYLINSTNNQINITISGITTLYTFPNGNYNVNSFITQWASTIGSGWTITFNSITNNFNFLYSSNFIFSDLNINSIFNIIGFVNGISYSSDFNNSLNSFCCVNFGGITKINIQSASFYLSNIDSFNGTVGDIICSIPVNSSQNGFIFYENYTNYKSVFNNRIINSISLEITDEFNNLINFNNIDFSLTLQIDMLREKFYDYDSINDIYHKEKKIM